MSADLIPYNLKWVPRPFGFDNTGVLCYANALCQALISCPSIVETTIKNQKYFDQTLTGKAFYKLMTNHGSTNQLIDALRIDLKNRRPNVVFGLQQESASEALTFLLDMLDVPMIENPISRLFYHRYQAKIFCKQCKKIKTTTDKATQINLFHPNRPNTPEDFVKYICNQVSDITDYKCENCKTNNAVRIYQLSMLPEIIVCVNNIYKQRTEQYFPQKICFPAVHGGDLIYQQVAQIEQFGQLHSGHYTARGLRNDNIYQFNDNNFSVSKFENTPNVYLVFYHFIH
jgi:uncharacterized UBP type Zn finger protein